MERLRYIVIESRAWVNNAGRTVSLYGSLPYWTEAQRIGEGWRVEVRGYTVENPYTGQVGIASPDALSSAIGRTPWKTREEAETFAATHTPSKIGYGD